MKKNVKKTLLFILMVAFSSVFLLHTFNDAKADAKLTYSVSPLLSGLPVENDSGYFQLRVMPGTHYDIPLLISNDTNNSINSITYIKGAKTADNGNIIYNKDKFPILSNVISKHIIKNKLGPHSSKIINYSLNTPQKKFKGTQLSGIITRFYTNSNSEGINNSISYINGLSLTEYNIKNDVKK